MKATFEFDMNEPSERREHYMHTVALDLWLALFHLANNHENDRVRAAVWREIGERGIAEEKMPE